MKQTELSSWVKPYKTKGHQIRLVKNSFCLYKVTSSYDKNKKYPKLVQEFVGVIDKEKGLVSKKVNLDSSFIEFGLSNLIFVNFKRDLIRSLFNNEKESNDYVVRLDILYYIFNSLDERILNYSYISLNYINELKSLIKSTNTKRIISLPNKIDSYLDIKLGNDKPYYVSRLKLIVIKKSTNNFNDLYPKDLSNKLKEKGFKL